MVQESNLAFGPLSFSQKTGIDIDLIIVDVSENTGKYAKGLVTTKGETVGGGYWLAVKTDGKWKVVFDASGNLVTRN